ncbi:glutamate 5-kinase [Fusibacter paucivorans]|uniref:Glutamate 5-kinase n=1 Tax=Fusibacter paucivorans TaxID=76009 RepID=A0ABS5PSV0_9FIRM|nr:glutamate 5-kinase [Fusibacter paucivorans]MBS7528161.1 glutamate 5-kinase [Fusibacter paucivorans]
MRSSIIGLNRIVIKIGSSSLTHESGLIDLWKMEKLVRQIVNVYNSGKEVIIVSSGAIAAGMGKMKLKERPKTIPEKQAAAAVGQTDLMHMYEKLFSEYGVGVAQVLLTKEDMYEPTRVEHCKNALDKLLEHQVIPIINENDVVAIDEIKVGDNDTLSAEVCKLTDFEMLIILSDIDGVFNKDPHRYDDAEQLFEIKALSELESINASGTDSNVGTGGMITKFNAARILHGVSKRLLIVNSATENVINKALNGEKVGTYFNFH